MTIGLISDTHGYFDPELPKLFAGVDHILHAGDIGGQHIIDELMAIAPVTAVLGNNDFDPTYRETEVIKFHGHRILLHHIVPRPHAGAALMEKIQQSGAKLVIFGHTHTRSLDREDDILWINPGYFGKPRPYTSRSLALLTVSPTQVEAQFIQR